jgi:hypothetical protein
VSYGTFWRTGDVLDDRSGQPMRVLEPLSDARESILSEAKSLLPCVLAVEQGQNCPADRLRRFLPFSYDQL